MGHRRDRCDCRHARWPKAYRCARYSLETPEDAREPTRATWHQALRYKFVAVSHTHPDHIGNISMFPQSTLLVQKAEYEWPSPFARALQAGPSAVNKLEGDHDVFGDGSVMLIATPGIRPDISRS